MKNSAMKPITLLLTIVVLLSGCASMSKDSTPSWLDNLYDAKYKEDTYLCAVGSGSSREKAVDAALSSLSQVFNSQVRSITSVLSLSTAQEDMAGEVKFTEASEMFEQSSITSTTEKIVGAQVVNTYIDSNKRVYVRVALDRKKSAEIYQKEIFDLDRSIMDVKKKMISSDDPLTQFFTLSQAVGYATKQQRLYDQIQVLLKKSQNSNLMILTRELNLIASTVNIAIRVDSSMGKEVLTAAFSKTLVDLGFKVVQDEKDSTATLIVGYESTPITLENSPYKYERYAMSATLLSGSTTLYSYQKNEREAAMSEVEAREKALISASTNGVNEFFILLEETLGVTK